MTWLSRFLRSCWSLWHDNIHERPAKSQISVHSLAVWSALAFRSSGSKDPKLLHAFNHWDSGQTAEMRWLIWVLARCSWDCLCFVMLRLFWAASWQNQQSGMCAQRRLRSAWVSAQSDQSLRCTHEESLGPFLPIERTAKTLIRLGGCPGWSESSLGVQSFCWFCREAAHLIC